MGIADQEPAALINGVILTDLVPEDVPAILSALRQNLSVEHRDALRVEADQIIQWCYDAPELHKGFVHAHQALHDTFATFPSNYISTGAPDGGMELYNGRIADWLTGEQLPRIC